MDPGDGLILLWETICCVKQNVARQGKIPIIPVIFCDASFFHQKNCTINKILKQGNVTSETSVFSLLFRSASKLTMNQFLDQSRGTAHFRDFKRHMLLHHYMPRYTRHKNPPGLLDPRSEASALLITTEFFFLCCLGFSSCSKDN